MNSNFWLQIIHEFYLPSFDLLKGEKKGWK